MHIRINAVAKAPEAYAAVAALDQFVVAKSGIEKRFLHLIKIRASQINFCAYCVNMHVKEARADGFGQQWVDMICVWQESTAFSLQERAVLQWTESLTNISQTRAPDADFDPLREYFDDEQIVNLIIAIGTINIWNRVAVGLRNQHTVDKS